MTRAVDALESGRRLRRVRRILRHRTRARPFGEVATTVYGAVLGSLVAGAPIVRAIVLSLAGPDVQAALGVLVPAGLAGGVASAVLVAAAVVGPTRGAAVPSPAIARLAAWGPLARRRVLAADALRTAATTSALLAGIAAVVAGAALVAGAIGPSSIAPLVVSAAALGPVATAVLLVAQAVPETRAWIVAAATTVLGVAAALLPGPLGLLPSSGVQRVWAAALAASPDGPADAAAWTGVTVVAAWALVAALAVPFLLDALTGTTIERHAARWERAGTAVAALDGAGAASVLRAPPVLGRRIRAVGPGPRALVTLRLDAVVALRRPVVLVSSAAGLVAAGALLAVAGVSPVAWGVAGAVALAGTTGLAGGLRDAGDRALGPALHGDDPAGALRRHAAWPVACGVLLAGGTALALGGAAAGAAGVLLAVLATAAVACTSVKGPLPTGLLAPTATAVGDPSIVLVLAWQVDALLIVVVGCVLAAVALDAGAVGWSLAAAGAAIGLLLLTTSARVRSA